MVASAAWLRPLEHCLNLWPHTLKHFGHTAESSIFFNGLKDWELGRTLNRSAATGIDNLPHQMVESGTEVEKRVSNDWV